MQVEEVDGQQVPLYEYECLQNGHVFEVRHPITADPVKECPQCGSEVRRIIHPVGIVFKGSGFYATDSRGKGVTTPQKSAETGGESKPAETSDSKPAGEGTGKKDSSSGKSGGDSKAASSTQTE